MTPITRADIITTLQKLSVTFEIHDHPAVFTTQDVVRLTHKLPGQDTKNLFLRDEKRTTFILVCVRADIRVNLKELGKTLGIKGITFGSPEELQSLLGVTPGSVCLFALANDSENMVRGFLDAGIDLEGQMQNHPLENTATVVLPVAGMRAFCEEVGHPLTALAIPERA